MSYWAGEFSFNFFNSPPCRCWIWEYEFNFTHVWCVDEKFDTFSVNPCQTVSSSASTTDLSSGFDSGTYLTKSPDQYSSRGSMESLDHPISSQHHSGAQNQHSLGHYSHSGPHPAYSSCHQLSSSRYAQQNEQGHSNKIVPWHMFHI